MTLGQNKRKQSFQKLIKLFLFEDFEIKENLMCFYLNESEWNLKVRSEKNRKINLKKISSNMNLLIISKNVWYVYNLLNDTDD